MVTSVGNAASNSEGTPRDTGGLIMKSHKGPASSDVSLDLHGSTPVAIAAEKLATEHFAMWLDGELEKLVARWEHLAAPKARLGTDRFGRSRRG